MENKSDIGNYYNMLESYASEHHRNFVYSKLIHPEHSAYKYTAREKVKDILGFMPQSVPLNAETIASVRMNGYTEETIEFDSSPFNRVTGSFLIPDGEGPFPAIIALHDHSGYYYFGRQKILEMKDEPDSLTHFKKESYDGVSWASEAARRGYAVLCIDAYYFGTRRADFSKISDEMLDRYGRIPSELAEGSSEYIDRFNGFGGNFESLLVRHINISGASWPGILNFDDRRSIDYLFTRTEVDTARIGCCGLSLGGLRSALLAGLDERIKCSVVAGWMTTFNSLLFNNLRYHTFMLYATGLSRHADLPDIVALTAPNPLFVQQCSNDILYNPEGMKESCAKIQSVYGELGKSDLFKSGFYDNGHKFTIQMQKEAFEWLDYHLKKGNVN